MKNIYGKKQKITLIHYLNNMNPLTLFVCIICMLSSCAFKEKEPPFHPFSGEKEVNTINDFLEWRKELPPLEKCYICMRSSHTDIPAQQDYLELDGILAEYINYVASLPVDKTKNAEFWCTPKSLFLGDILIGNKHFVWATTSYLSELNTRSVYFFPAHFEVLVSSSCYKNPYMIRRDERERLLLEFNQRWNHVMEYLIQIWSNRS